MSEASLPKAGSEMEMFGPLGDSFERSNISRLEAEKSVREYIYYMGDPSNVVNAYENHGYWLGQTVYNIFEHDLKDRYKVTDSIDLVTAMLYEDDANRVKFFQETVGKTEQEKFESHYLDYEQLNTFTQSLFVSFADEEDPFKKLTDEIMRYHLAYTKLDLASFLRSDFLNQQFRQRISEKRLQNETKRDGWDYAALATSALALGGLAAAYIWRKFKKF